MNKATIFIIHSDYKLAEVLENSVLRPAGYEVTQVRERQSLDVLLQAGMPEAVIVGSKVPSGSGLELAEELLEGWPDLPLIIASDSSSDDLMLQALRVGASDYLKSPFGNDEVIQAIDRAVKRQERLSLWSQKGKGNSAFALKHKVEGMEALQRIGRKVTSTLDLDSVLASVVDAAVELTGAEEGSLLLLDEVTGEIYMRAARNFREEFVRTFRVPISDSLLGEVVRSGQPLLLNTATPKKIKTSYLVHTLMYVPLLVSSRVIGILGIDNRRSGHPFSEDHLGLVSALADYAAIAVENARLYSTKDSERNKFQTLLTNIQDGVIVLDEDGRLVLINRSAQEAFLMNDADVIDRYVNEVITNEDFLGLLGEEGDSSPQRGEISLGDGRVMSVQVTPIAGVGQAVIMQDISYLKELDRIKSDFVSMVSHDLRSPLTAILGYMELIGRVGPLNPQQREFIQRMQISVENITSLINDLLDLGRIEAGFDARKEILPLSAILRYTIESLQVRAEQKKLTLELDIQEGLPKILGNPMHLRQMFDNLVANAIHYTPHGGEIKVMVRSEGDQIIIRISDTGLGIPPADQPYIFDKFYRASNTPPDTPGAGLGLAIVKSIVDSHQGRIWIDSVLGKGSTFTIVLPATDPEL
jgi:two-component system NtrC family sensor kinase